MAPDETDANVSAVVKILLAYKHMRQSDLSAGAGIPKRTVIRRMGISGGGWTAGEIAALSRMFGVPAQVFYDGPDALMAGARGHLSAYMTTESPLIAA